MPRGCRDKKRMAEIGKGTQFRGGNAAEGGTGAINGKKGNETKAANATWKATFKQRLTPEAMEKICDAVIERGINGDLDAVKLMRDTMGEKPTDRVELEGGEMPLNVNIRVVE